MPGFVHHLRGSEELAVHVRRNLDEARCGHQRPLLSMQELAYRPDVMFPAERVPGCGRNTRLSGPGVRKRAIRRQWRQWRPEFDGNGPINIGARIPLRFLALLI